jgi:hypothetical protein
MRFNAETTALRPPVSTTSSAILLNTQPGVTTAWGRGLNDAGRPFASAATTRTKAMARFVTAVETTHTDVTVELLARTPKEEGDRKNDTQTLCTREMSEKS